MSYSNIRTETKAVLDAISGIGKTYSYVRRPQTITNRDDLFVTSAGVFHVWFITRTSVDSDPLTSAGLLKDHVIRLIGYHEVNDDGTSELTFQDLIDTIMASFDSLSNIPLNDTGDQLVPAQLVEFNFATEFNSVICHEAIIEIVANEQI